MRGFGSLFQWGKTAKMLHGGAVVGPWVSIPNRLPGDTAAAAPGPDLVEQTRERVVFDQKWR